MAITHFTPQLISRGDGRSAVLSAAYRHCARMEFERELQVADYSSKRGLLHEAFSVPSDAPEWARALIADRPVAGASEAFWNRVEAFEKRSDAQLAKEFIIALPVELSTGQNIALVRDFVEAEVLARGQVADWVYHESPGNPHVHLMTSLRPLTEDGFGSKKVAVLDERGAPLRNTAGRIVYRLWSGEKSEFLSQRQTWLDLQNRHLALAGLDVRVDGRSYAERGIDIVPTAHIGVATRAIDRKGGDKSGWSPKLDRLRIFEETRLENRARILRRPELVLDLVSREMSVFTERDVAKVLHRYVDDATVFRQLLVRILQSAQVVRLERERIAFGTGVRVPEKFTTRDLVRLEARMVMEATWLASRPSGDVGERVLEQTFARHRQLSDEQRAAIAHVAGEGRLAAVVGRAGAGKTTMMKAAREAFEAAGYRVVGGALAGKAAEGLEREAGIASRTLSSWELAWSKGRDGLDARAVFVLDEAGMVSSRQMAAFVDAAVRTGARLVLIGDPDQLQPIEAGAAFRAIAERTGYAELETIYRQRQQWMRDASLDLARGKVGDALAAYEGQGRLHPSRLKDQAVAHLIDDWNRDHDPARTQLILAHLRRDVHALNEMARARLVERGLVAEGDPFSTTEGERRFAAGDQIVFLKNDQGLGVKNGMIGHVVEARSGWLVATVGEGGHRARVEVDQRFYAHVDHGYATTIHKSQGATVDRVKVLASLSLDRHLTYVAMTRHREDVGLYYGARSFDKAGGLIPILSTRRAKETTLDYERGSLYRDALRYAEARGLHLMRVARTLMADRLQWTVRQRERLAELGEKLLAIGARLGIGKATLSRTQTEPVAQEVRPMLAGITTFSRSIADTVEDRLGADTALKRQWEDVSLRFRLVFADPEAAFRAVDMDAVLADTGTREKTLQTLASQPESFGAIRGRTGLMASKAQRQARARADVNVPALVLDIERYLKMRAGTETRFNAEEQAVRKRLAIDIPALSSAAHRMLDKIRDAIDRNDMPAAIGFAMANREIRGEIDRFTSAVTERFGERAFLGIAARNADGQAFQTIAAAMTPAQKVELQSAWPVLRTVQQLAAHERTVEGLKQAETLHLRMGHRQRII
ncbi:MAG TPA: Ti-type conjugative transfer relaxase TraA [Rhizobium sp.]|nr:Ti-type conjugative transfer relaxase TraA [Rhizobium sp.]